ncbi:response regulator transcription factor [Bradyrhizobium sp. PMVTL-01]|uniref:response regulator transcription factor n=1 Tax=Bradyrhizobium sp. PMVTL-01 TaxID=3434999 RepID=UPI003F700F2A
MDDAEFRASVGRLLRTVGMHSEQFASVTEFLAAAPNPNGPTCLLVDMRMPRPSGLDLQRELANVGKHLPIVFITAHADIPMTVLATKRDAIEFLTQPFRDQDLIDAVEPALLAIEIVETAQRHWLPSRSDTKRSAPASARSWSGRVRECRRSYSRPMVRSGRTLGLRLAPLSERLPRRRNYQPSTVASCSKRISARTRVQRSASAMNELLGSHSKRQLRTSLVPSVGHLRARHRPSYRSVPHSDAEQRPASN